MMLMIGSLTVKVLKDRIVKLIVSPKDNLTKSVDITIVGGSVEAQDKLRNSLLNNPLLMEALNMSTVTITENN